MNRTISFVVFSLTIYCFSCSDFLDAKSDSSFALPDNVQDLQALLDNEDIMNMQFPAAGDIASDYYFLEDNVLATRSIDTRDTYQWMAEAQNPQDWSYAYTRIFNTNVVLDEIDNAKLGNMTEVDRQEIKGRAYFFRGWTYLQLAQLYTPFHADGMQDSEYGLPLKLSSDINQSIVRSSVQDTYGQIIEDLSRSLRLLPVKSEIATRPSKTAAYAALARLYLILGDYRESLSYTDSCLQIHYQLIDYNQLDSKANAPFAVLNDEIIFHAVALGTSGVHSQARAFVVPQLRERFDDSDLRKKLFFREDKSGYFRFKGSPSGSTASIFAGLALDEIYLIRAECQARTGEEEAAVRTLNSLLVNFWEPSQYDPIPSLIGDELLTKIIEEREKQLMFRAGIRWSDLRRLNAEGRFKKELKRSIGGKVYSLPSNDVRYTFLLPYNVVEMSGIKQNPR